MGANFRYGDVLKQRSALRVRQGIRVQFIRSATLKEHPGNMERMFLGVTVRGTDKSLTSMAKVGRINLFPYGDWMRDE